MSRHTKHGAALETMLQADGISCDFCYLKSGRTRINVKLKAEGELDINADGPTISKEDTNALFSQLEHLKKGDFLILSGSVPKGMPDDTYEKILKRLSDKEVCFVVDAEGELLLNVLKYKPFLIKPNHHELGALFKTEIKTEAELLRCAEKLQKAGARNVLVSRAENGALLLDENGTVYQIENADGKLVNSAGCGDSMVGGFIAGYLQRQDYAYALKLGTACGNATAFSDSLASAQEIDEVFRRLNEVMIS